MKSYPRACVVAMIVCCACALRAQNIPCLEELYHDSALVVERSNLVYSQDHFTGGRVYTNGESDIYVTGTYVIFVSNDRGKQWRVAYIDPNVNVFWRDAIVVDDKTFIGVGVEGSIVRSKDRGATWERIETGHNRILTTISAWGRTVVYVDNIVAEIVISFDAGDTWIRRPIDTTLLPKIWGVNEMCFAGPTTLILPMGTGTYRSTLVTKDLGKTWSVSSACGNGRAVEYYSESIGLALSADAYKYNPDGTQADDRSYGSVYKTTDGGNTYRMVLVDSTDPKFGLNSLAIHSNGMAFAGGPEKFYVSWNFGETWIRSIDKLETVPHGFGTARFMKDGNILALFSASFLIDLRLRGTPATTVSEHREPDAGERCTQVQVYDMMGRLLATSQPDEVVTVKAILERHHSELPIAPVFILATTEHGEQLRSAVHPAIHVK
ncbi:hypothetical protein BH10BAC6_BH10BAC6_02200 [soil metagenome]